MALSATNPLPRLNQAPQLALPSKTRDAGSAKVGRLNGGLPSVNLSAPALSQRAPRASATLPRTQSRAVPAAAAPPPPALPTGGLGG